MEDISTPLHASKKHNSAPSASAYAVSAHRHGNYSDEEEDYDDNHDAQNGSRRFDHSPFSPSSSSSSFSALSAVEANRPIWSQLKSLSELYKDDQWRTNAYTQAYLAVQRHPHPITTEAEARKVPGLVSKCLDKVIKIINSGGMKLERLAILEAKEDVRVRRLFESVHGIGPNLSEKLYRVGFRTLDDLKRWDNLTDAQRFYIDHYDDLTQRIPRSEVELFVKEAADALRYISDRDPLIRVLNPQLVALGSYRRGQATVGDVDIMITVEDDMKSLTEFVALLSSSSSSSTSLSSLSSSHSSHIASQFAAANGACVTGTGEDVIGLVSRILLARIVTQLTHFGVLVYNLACSVDFSLANVSVSASASSLLRSRSSGDRADITFATAGVGSRGLDPLASSSSSLSSSSSSSSSSLSSSSSSTVTGPLRSAGGRGSEVYSGIGRLPSLVYREYVHQQQRQHQRGGQVSSAPAASSGSGGGGVGGGMETGPHRRIDIRMYRASESGCATLYFTGSKEFNRAIRRYANDRGYTLSDHNLVYKGGGKPGLDKGPPVLSHYDSASSPSSSSASTTGDVPAISSGPVVLPCRTERDVFQHLGLPYVEPEARTFVPMEIQRKRGGTAQARAQAAQAL